MNFDELRLKAYNFIESINDLKSTIHRAYVIYAMGKGLTERALNAEEEVIFWQFVKMQIKRDIERVDIDEIMKR